MCKSDTKITDVISDKDSKIILKKLLLDEINIINKQNIAKRLALNTKKTYKIKYSDEYYLDCILEVLQSITSWKVLQKLTICKSNSEFHYKTIENKYRTWASQNVFINAFNKYLSVSKSNLLYVDATPINNKGGSENITLQVENKKKKITKLSVIANSSGFIYSITPFEIKQTIVNDNGKKIYSTSIHDVKMLDNSLLNIENINPNIENRYFKLFGDKAYITKDKYRLKSKPITTITPNKTNAVNNLNTPYHKKQLKSRYIIEFCNKNLKNYDRIMTRKDKKIKYFMGFVFISALLNNIKKNK